MEEDINKMSMEELDKEIDWSKVDLSSSGMTREQITGKNCPLMDGRPCTGKNCAWWDVERSSCIILRPAKK